MRRVDCNLGQDRDSRGGDLGLRPLIGRNVNLDQSNDHKV